MELVVASLAKRMIDSELDVPAWNYLKFQPMKNFQKILKKFPALKFVSEQLVIFAQNHIVWIEIVFSTE